MRRRDLVTGSAALAAYAGLSRSVSAWPVVPGIYGGGGPAYSVGAVAFDGATALMIPSLSATDRMGWTLSMWLKIDSNFFSSPPSIFENILLVSDPDNAYYSYFALANSNSGAYPPAWSIASSNLPNSSTDFINNNTPSPGTGWTDPVVSQWLHCFFSFDNSTSPPHHAKLLINGVDVTGTFPTNQRGPANVPFNGFSFWIGDDDDLLFGGTDCYIGGLAEYWFNTGTVLDVSGNVPSAILNAFLDPVTKGPVNLGANGQLPLGSAPTFFGHQPSGNSDPTQIALDRSGNGNNMSIVNVTATGALVNTQNTITVDDSNGVVENLANGLAISATGIPSNTVVTNVNTTTKIITISNPVTVTNPTASLTFGALTIAPSHP